mmetsp:Transcript_579/g.2083  ORF Transcript_579/g.2083 Transcript_579/m.2083 type:complete len:183 (-) Transcript_579:225-773(-)
MQTVPPPHDRISVLLDTALTNRRKIVSARQRHEYFHQVSCQFENQENCSIQHPDTLVSSCECVPPSANRCFLSSGDTPLTSCSVLIESEINNCEKLKPHPWIRTHTSPVIQNMHCNDAESMDSCSPASSNSFTPEQFVDRFQSIGDRAKQGARRLQMTKRAPLRPTMSSSSLMDRRASYRRL